MTPCMKILCSYKAIKAPKVSGVNFLIKSVFVGLFPAKYLKGAKKEAFSEVIFCFSNSVFTCLF